VARYLSCVSSATDITIVNTVRGMGYVLGLEALEEKRRKRACRRTRYQGRKAGVQKRLIGLEIEYTVHDYHARKTTQHIP